MGFAPMQIMSFTFMATQSMPIVSHFFMASAIIPFEPILSVHMDSAYSPKSIRPVKCPGRAMGLPKPLPPVLICEIKVSMVSDSFLMSTPALAYVKLFALALFMGPRRRIAVLDSKVFD